LLLNNLFLNIHQILNKFNLINKLKLFSLLQDLSNTKMLLNNHTLSNPKLKHFSHSLLNNNNSNNNNNLYNNNNLNSINSLSLFLLNNSLKDSNNLNNNNFNLLLLRTNLFLLIILLKVLLFNNNLPLMEIFNTYLPTNFNHLSEMTTLNNHPHLTLMLDHFNSLHKISINTLKITKFIRLEILIEESKKPLEHQKKLSWDILNNLLNKDLRFSIDNNIEDRSH
jgi:hypothetical protein